ncbi:MAG TPA: BON domain-containing protein [Roseateles sp.]
MKFPKSVHPEGWLDHIEKGSEPKLASARPAGAPLKPRTPRPSAKIRATDPLGWVSPEPMTTPGASPVRRSGHAMPWVVGVGAGAALIVLAASMSRQFSTPTAAELPPIVTGQVAPPADAASSPEDVLLAEAPAAAGAVAAEPAPAVEPATQVAAVSKPVETPKPVAAPKVEAPAPVVRTLTPPPETLAQAAPPPALQPEPPPAAPVVTPPSAEPPVLAQQTNPVAPPVAAPEDTGITIKVREALASDSTLAVVPIAVSTDHGIVKLEGQAPDAQTKERATVVAAATSGVRGVDNRLTLPAVTVGQLMQNGGS